MLMSHAILGTSKPIFKERETNHFLLNEIVHLNMNPEDFEVAGYILSDKRNALFKPVYSLKSITCNHETN